MSFNYNILYYYVIIVVSKINIEKKTKKIFNLNLFKFISVSNQQYID